MSGLGKPRFVKKAGEYRWHWFLPASKLVKPVPIKVWATPITDGWQGWLDSQRKRGSVIPGFYSKEAWKETTEKKAELAKEAAKAAQATANVGPAAKAAPTVKLTGKQIREAATAAGKAERASKAGPSVAKAAEPVRPEPEPEPTGTDPGTGGNETVISEPDAIASALETAVQTLASVAQGLRRVSADSRGKARPITTVATKSASKPGLRKAMPTTAPAVKQRATRR